MKLKLSGSVGSFNSVFRELIEICVTPLEEGYMPYFTGLSDVFKAEFTRLFPTESPTDYQEMYQKARNFELSRHWVAPIRSDTNKNHGEKRSARNKSVSNNGSGSGYSQHKETVYKDPQVSTWALPRNVSVTTIASTNGASCAVRNGKSDTAVLPKRRHQALLPPCTQKPNAARKCGAREQMCSHNTVRVRDRLPQSRYVF